MRFGLLIALGALALGPWPLALGVSGAEAREPQRVITDAVWKRKPNGEEFAALYPTAARNPQRGGWATILKADEVLAPIDAAP